ncbi:MAG: hypothetical protein ACREUQ_03275 [Burkholderiales bacterium]
MFERIQALLRGRYVRLLEEEVARLRAENRALVNSLLGTAGFPPVDFPEANSQTQGVPRLRKRSWHQMQAWREAGAARELMDEKPNGPIYTERSERVPHS